MRSRLQNLAPLVVVAVLAVALTFAMSRGAWARTTFQSSIETPPGGIATFTPEPSFTPGVGDSPTQPVVETTQTVPGFLPPPTLVNPNVLVPGQPTPLAPDNRPLVGPAAPPEPTAIPVLPAAPGAAQLIDSGVVALSYLWLCCGALLLAAAGLAILWLWRRSKRR